MKRLLFLMALAPMLAHAQFVYAPTSAGPFVPLDGATIKGKVHVRIQQTTGVPWVLSFDGVIRNTETACPCVLANETGSQNDNNLWNTAANIDGKHTVTAKNAATTLTATFTIVNAVAPQPPPLQPPVSEKPGEARVTWAKPLTWSDGAALTTLLGYVFHYGQTNAAGDQNVSIPDPAALGYTVKGLTPGVWYFKVESEALYIIPPAPGVPITGQPSPVLSVTVGAPPVPPPPQDCVLSPWHDDTFGPWLPEVCANGTQTSLVQQSRVVVTPPLNGGAECGQLVGQRAQTRPCTVPPPVNVCDSDPLVFTVRSWPGGASGSRSLGYTSNKVLVDLLLKLPLPVSVTATDSRGCAVTVTK